MSYLFFPFHIYSGSVDTVFNRGLNRVNCSSNITYCIHKDTLIQKRCSTPTASIGWCHILSLEFQRIPAQQTQVHPMLSWGSVHGSYCSNIELDGLACPDLFSMSLLCVYTVKKFKRFSRPQPGCHWLNSPWAGIFPPRESLVSDITSGDGKIV